MFQRLNVTTHQAVMFPALFIGGFITSAATLPALNAIGGSGSRDATNSATSLFEWAKETAVWLSGQHTLLAIGAGVIALVIAAAIMLTRSGSAGFSSNYSGQGISDDAYREVIEDVGVKLDDELTEILKLLDSQATSNERYADLLLKTDKALPKLKDPKQVQQILHALIIENKKSHQESVDLQKSLEQSRSQIDDLHHDLNEAQREGLRDALTSLGNRRMFDKSLTQEIEKSDDTNARLSLVMTDIDHFKKFNDTYGHQIGDEVLKVFAQMMQKNTKGKDIVARYGGEEFALILPDTDCKDARILIEQIRLKLQNKKLKNNKNGETISKVTASFGIAQHVAGQSREELIERADAKLYEAKRNGRNCIVVDNG